FRKRSLPASGMDRARDAGEHDEARSRMLRRLGPRRGLDINIDLLADETRELTWGECVNRLEHPCVDTFGDVAGQRLLRQHVGFEAHERECDRNVSIAA